MSKLLTFKLTEAQAFQIFESLLVAEHYALCELPKKEHSKARRLTKLWARRYVKQVDAKK